MKRHALFVGVDQYIDGHIPNLSCAVSDATDLHGFFKYGASYDQVELLPNPSSKKEVLGAARSLTSDLGPGDFFLFFFAGHGFRVGENHVLVCSNDLYDDVKYEDDGLPLGQLERRISGSFDSALILDACQSDILATRGGEGISERDIELIHKVPTVSTGVGTITIVTSCDKGQTAAELSERRHGLFTVAMLDLLNEAQRAHSRLDLSDAFRINLGRRMGEIAARFGLPTEQRPRFSCTGNSSFILLDGIDSIPASQTAAIAIAPPASLVCPECGMYNVITNTFKCKVCGRDHLCKEHYSKDERCCADCAEKVRVHRAAEEKARRETEEKARLAALPKTGDVKTLVLPGGAEMEMIYCAPGEFMMGSPQSEEGRKDDEVLHQVKLTKGFWLGKYPVTQGQWQSVKGNPSYFKGDAHLPVERVSWDDCRDFIDRVKSFAKQQLGGEARFPTEAEWEYACRAGTTTVYFWGNDLNGDRANCDGNHPCGTVKKGQYLGNTMPVGCYCANAWGFADMHGNVWEWCSDWYGDYPKGSVVDPAGPASGVCRVHRGGSWFDFAMCSRSAYRSRSDPGDRHSFLGFRLCCSAGSAHEMYKHGLDFYYGRNGVAKNYAEAIRYFREAADKGNANAQCYLGMMYSHGEGVPKNFVEAVKWYEQAASRGDLDAQFSLGVMYEKGRGVAQDYAKALRWYRKAADQGQAKAFNNLSVMYLKGKGVAKDEVESLSLCRRAAELGSRSAQDNLGFRYENGRGVTKDDAEAVRWYRKAAERGLALAQYHLGRMYVNGCGIEKDEMEAAKWFRKAAEQGDESAQCYLGWMYGAGRGVAKDEVEAVKWYRKAADRGHAHSQYNLGWMYENGRGVTKDDAEAVKWYRKSADQGDKDATKALERFR